MIQTSNSHTINGQDFSFCSKGWNDNEICDVRGLDKPPTGRIYEILVYFFELHPIIRMMKRSRILLKFAVLSRAYPPKTLRCKALISDQVRDIEADQGS